LRLQNIILRRKTGEYRILLSIFHTGDPQKLADEIDQQMTVEVLPDAQFDKDSMERLKTALSSNPKFQVR
jgi:hypothetical protein